MPLPVIPSTFRVAFVWSGGTGFSAVNVAHFRTTAAGTAASLNTALNAAVTGAMWLPVTTSAGILTKHILPLDGVSATSVFAGVPGAYDGQTAGQFSPSSAAIVSIRTGLRGPRHRGRLYLPFPSEGAINNGAVSIAVATWQAAWDNFQATMLGASWECGVASYKHSDFSVATAFVCEGELATQRRRQDRLR